MYIDRNAQLVQAISNCVGYEAIKKGQYNNIWEFLILTSTFTCVCDALDLHVDIPKKNPILNGNDGFIETRVLIPIDFLSTFDSKDSPLGRGRGGPGVYVVALIDHFH